MSLCVAELNWPHTITFSGSPCEFVVNTSSAGPGALAVTIDGPSKVKMDCQECPEGYKVTYTPMAPGNYLISIKYGGPYHIVGSPFKAKITGKKKCNQVWLQLSYVCVAVIKKQTEFTYFNQFITRLDIKLNACCFYHGISYFFIMVSVFFISNWFL